MSTSSPRSMHYLFIRHPGTTHLVGCIASFREGNNLFLGHAFCSRNSSDMFTKAKAREIAGGRARSSYQRLCIKMRPGVKAPEVLRAILLTIIDLGQDVGVPGGLVRACMAKLREYDTRFGITAEATSLPLPVTCHCVDGDEVAYCRTWNGRTVPSTDDMRIPDELSDSHMH